MARRLLTGNEALAHAALEAGAGFVCGCPGYPSTDVVQTVAKLRSRGRAQAVNVEWSTNEAVAMESAAAASIAGKRSLAVFTHDGLNVAGDALTSLMTIGTRAGLVIFVADDPGPTSSETVQDSRQFSIYSKTPLLDAADPEQLFYMTKAAFVLSERCALPVIVRATSRICQTGTFFDVSEKTSAISPLALFETDPDSNLKGINGFKRDAETWTISPRNASKFPLEIAKLHSDIVHTYVYDEVFAQFNALFINGRRSEFPSPDSEVQFAPETTVGIIVGGDSTNYALEGYALLREQAMSAGLVIPPVRILQVGCAYPFPKRTLTRFMKGLSDVLVIEELDPYIEEELLKIAGTSFLAPTIHGKLTNEMPLKGEYSTERCAIYIARFFDKVGEARTPNIPIEASQSLNLQQPKDVYASLIERILSPHVLYSYGKELPARRPVLCAGCPHRASFYDMNKAFDRVGIERDDAIVCGDLGCLMLGKADPLDAIDACLCLGSSSGMAQGFSTGDPYKKSIAVMGDGAFFSDGLSATANAVYNQHDITLFVLDNSTCAMTDLASNPGSGINLMSHKVAPISIEKSIRALGINNVSTVDPLDEDSAEEAIAEALSANGPSAVVLKSPCIWLEKHDDIAFVMPAKCTGCRKCITETGCPAITFNTSLRGSKSGRRGQARINSDQCVGCGLCAHVCPFDAIGVVARSRVATGYTASQEPSDEAKDLPMPSRNAQEARKRNSERIGASTAVGEADQRIANMQNDSTDGLVTSSQDEAAAVQVQDATSEESRAQEATPAERPVETVKDASNGKPKHGRPDDRSTGDNLVYEEIPSELSIGDNVFLNFDLDSVVKSLGENSDSLRSGNGSKSNGHPFSGFGPNGGVGR